MKDFISVLKQSFSSKIVLFLCAIIMVFRLSYVSEKETSWDVLGYYLPLPATFIYDDALMQNRQWMEEINEEKDLTGTLYQISTTPSGEPMYFFLLGMAMLFLPFFLMGHAGAYLFGYPMDGFSMPYQYALVIGGLIYTFIGLFYLRKILRHFFTERISGIVLLIIVLATNYSHHLSLKNLETVNVLFMLVSLLIWNTIQWHNRQKISHLIFIGISITFMSMVKPSEVLIVFLPVFYGVYNRKTLAAKWKLIASHKSQFFWMALVCLALALPQMSYWYVRTGSFFYDSYINPGVGLDVTSPYILESLFSFKKGWFIYTPVMILSLVGFYFFFQKRREIAFSFLLYFLFTAYIIFSWTEWWYGAAFSNRPLITVYPILAVALGFFIQYVSHKGRNAKIATFVFVLLSMGLNQFQWWQLRTGILEPYRMTKEYYFASFLKTSVTNADRELLSVYRDFGEGHTFGNKNEYTVAKRIEFLPADLPNSGTIEKGSEFMAILEKEYRQLSDKDHFWAEIEVEIMNSTPQKYPLLVTSIQRKEGEYGYFANTITQSSQPFVVEYMTPNIRSRKDRFKVYIWNRSKERIEVKKLIISIFEKK